MTALAIRALAICILSSEGRILVNEAHDSVKSLSYCRPLGGGIEFGETGERAIRREIREEIDADLVNVRYLGTLENIFTNLGKPGHEIVMVYAADFADRSLYRLQFIPGVESNGEAFRAQWRSLESFDASLPLFPEGLSDLLYASERHK